MFNNMLGNDVLRLLTQSSSQFMHNWEKATRLQLSCFCCSSSCSRRERHRVRCFIMTCICHLVLVLYLMLIRSLHDFHSRSARPVPHQNFVPDLRESLAPICKAQQLCKNAESVMQSEGQLVNRTEKVREEYENKGTLKIVNIGCQMLCKVLVC